MNFAMRLEKQLARLLERRDMTAAQLCRAASVPKQTISNWLAGRKPKDFDQVKRVADTLGVTLDFLLYGVEADPINELRGEILAGTFEVVLRRPRI